MKVVIFLKKYFFSGLIDKTILRNEIFSENIRRIIIATSILAPVSILHIIIFAAQPDSANHAEYVWRQGIMYSHTMIALVSVLAGTVFFLHARKKMFKPIIVNIVFYSLFPIITLLAVVIVTFDQLITPSITPFLIVCTLIALIFLIRPYISFLIFFGAYLIFYFAISITQTNPDILQSNRVNGFTAVGLGVCLSFIMWHSSVNRYRQSRIISKQNKKLHANNKELIEKSEELKIANATKDRFFSIVAHDLRGPVGTINAFLDYIKQNEIPCDDLRSYITGISDISASTMKLLDNLLTWARIQKGQISFTPQPCNFYQLIESNLELFAQAAQQKQICLENNIPENTEAVFDRDMIDTVFRNLINNAIKYTRENGKISVTAFIDKKRFFGIVEDTGTGMAQETLDTLFNIDNLHKSAEGTCGEKGTGFGLILCKEFVGIHKGEIKVNSELNKGTVFQVIIPQP